MNNVDSIYIENIFDELENATNTVSKWVKTISEEELKLYITDLDFENNEFKRIFKDFKHDIADATTTLILLAPGDLNTILKDELIKRGY